MNILVAEDDPIAQEMIRAFLEELDFDVTVADSGNEAWRLFCDSPTRMVITDWQMPGMTGLELCRRIREEYSGSYTYVVMLTANTHDISGLAAGADDFVTKPFDPEELRFRLKSGQRVLQLEDRLEDQIRQLNESQSELNETHKLLRNELNAAADLQRSLLPKELPNSDDLDFSWYFEPSEHLGGDTFNVYKLADKRYAIAVADVCGHGIKPALLAVTLQHVLNPRYRHTPLMWSDFATDPTHLVAPPTEVLARLNQQFPMTMENSQYFTMFYGVIESDTGKLSYSTAGHPPPMVLPAEGPAYQLPGSGVPIGFHDDAEFDPEATVINPGDRLLLFSDGLIETKNAANELVTTHRVLSWLDEARTLDTDSIVQLLGQNIRAWAGDARPDDDVSILMVDYTGQSESPVVEVHQSSGSRPDQIMKQVT